MELFLLPLLLLAGFMTTLDFGSDETSDDERTEGTDDDDQLVAGRNARVFGMAGDDEIVATDDAIVFGGAGDDTLYVGDNGDPSSVVLNGGAGDDDIYSALGDSESSSTLAGNAGEDYLYSIRAGDQLFGGDDADRLTAVNGVTMTGGAGNDIFELLESSTDGADGPMVITDYIAGEDQLAVSIGQGEWLDTMEITTQEVDGSTLINFAFDPNSPAFPEGLDNDALDIRAPDDFSILLEGVTDFDATTIQLLTSSTSDSVIDTLETFTIERGTSGDDLIENDNFAPTVIFAGDGEDTIISSFRATISAGDGDDIILHRLIAEPLDEVPDDDTATSASSWSFGGAGSDLIVLEDDFIPYMFHPG